MTKMQATSLATADIEASRTPEASKPAMLHILCDRDVGLFNLILSVIPHVDWAFSEGRIPIVYYGRGNCYWTPHGYRDRDTVWEYYFEPVIPEYPVSSIPPHIRELISLKPPVKTEWGHFVDEYTFVSNSSKAPIQFSARVKDYREPSDSLRQWTSAIIRAYVRPRDYIAEKVERFFRERLAGRYVIGVHIRGTDALVDPDRILKEHNVNFQKYFAIVERLLRAQSDSLIFVASDEQSSVDRMRERFGERVIAYDSIRHVSGELAGRGPNGGYMPGYLTQDPDLAARSGEEAVVEYLLLCRCDYLVHNGSGMPRAVLLTVPGMPASNTIAKRAYLRLYLRRANRASVVRLRRVISVWRHRATLVRDTIWGEPIGSWHRLLRELWIAKRAARREASRRE